MIRIDKLKSLDDWLDSATRGLCDDARERIAEEIAAHYEDALGEARGIGLTEEASVKKAVEALGDPRRALRKLHSEHLTIREAKKVQKFVGASKRYLRIHGVEMVDVFRRTFLVLGVAGCLFNVGWLIRWLESIYAGDGAHFTLAPLILGMFIGEVGLFCWIWKTLNRKHNPDGTIPVWRALQLDGIRGISLVACYAPTIENSLTSPHSPINFVADEWQHWALLGYLVFVALLTFALLGSAFQLRFAQKLRRLGYDDALTAMV